MALLLSSAASDAIKTTSTNPLMPSNGLLMTVGLWVRPDALSFYAWCWSRTAGAQFCTLSDMVAGAFSGSAAPWSLYAAGSVSDATAAVATNIVLGHWYFVVCRIITATNRRIAVLDSSTGAIEHAQSTISVNMSTLVNLDLGFRITDTLVTNGAFAEFWYTATDIQADAGQLDDATVRQLAYGGPFSVPHVAASVLEYRSLKSRLITADQSDEVFVKGAFPSWVTGGTGIGTITAHPPLPYWYRAPPQRDMTRIVPM